MNIKQDDIEYEFVIKPKTELELSHYVMEFSGTAMLWDDARSDDISVATMRGHRIDLASIRHDGGDVGELFESLYPDIHEFKSTAFDHNSCWLSEPGPEGDPIECQCLVYIDELVVDPEYRSHRIGTGMMKRMSEVIDLEHCLVGLKAFPISKDYGSERSVKEIQKLREFYRKLGFVHAGEHFYEKDGSQCAAPKKRREK